MDHSLKFIVDDWRITVKLLTFGDFCPLATTLYSGAHSSTADMRSNRGYIGDIFNSAQLHLVSQYISQACESHPIDQICSCNESIHGPLRTDPAFGKFDCPTPILHHWCSVNGSDGRRSVLGDLTPTALSNHNIEVIDVTNPMHEKRSAPEYDIVVWIQSQRHQPHYEGVGNEFVLI